MKKVVAGFCISLILIFFSSWTKNIEQHTGKIKINYVCMPCGSECDTTLHTEPGTCSHCNMALVDKSTIVHKNIQPDNLCSLNEKNVVFLDVRTAEEFNGTAEDKFGAIKNAINIPVQELATRMNELEKYKDKEIIVYCSHSHRSPRASYMLTQNGFKKVTNMLGGMSVWKDLVKKKDCNERLYKQQ
jgi:rhodanese-related sulfurtransferase/DNA-directed RNA polymerase subunit RPC12/RpoP